MATKMVSLIGAAVLLLVGGATGAVGHEDESATGAIHFYGQHYSGESFRPVLEELNAGGIFVQFLVLPDDSLLVVKTETELGAAMVEHFGNVPDGFFGPPVENPRGKRIRARQQSRRHRADDGAARRELSTAVAARLESHLCNNIHNMTARIWGHDHCGGTYLSFFGNDSISNLDSYGFSDVTSSIQVGGIMEYLRGYQHANYTGNVFNAYGNLDGTDRYYGAGVLGNASMHDQISSVKTGCSSC